MKFQGLLNSAMIAVLIALQGWTLSEIVALKVNVVRLQTQFEAHLQERHGVTNKTP